MKVKSKIGMIYLLAGLFILPAVQSCNKYEEGPGISLRSRKERISNTWKVDNYTINGDDFTSLVSDYEEIFTKDEDYSYTWGPLNGSGSWTFQNNAEQVKLNGSDDQSSRTLYILKLEEDALWYYWMDGEDRNEAHMIPK